MYSKPLLEAELRRDEGVRLKPYTDSVGKLTIGIGRNLTDVGISNPEASYLLVNDVASAEAQLNAHLSWWGTMSDARQRALLNMCFNMGWPKLSKFTTTIGHLQAGRYTAASATVLQSLWAQQVGVRADRISGMFRNG